MIRVKVMKTAAQHAAEANGRPWPPKGYRGPLLGTGRALDRLNSRIVRALGGDPRTQRLKTPAEIALLEAES